LTRITPVSIPLPNRFGAFSGFVLQARDWLMRHFQIGIRLKDAWLHMQTHPNLFLAGIL